MPNVIKQVVKSGNYGTQTIKTVSDTEFGVQTIRTVGNSNSNVQVIKMIVQDNERGPRGEQGADGNAATIVAGNAYSVASNANPAVINTGSSSNAVFDFYIPKGEKGESGKDGKDGAVHYEAGVGIEITPNNVINATGEAVASWGGIEGTLSNQTDLKNALDAKQDTLTAGTNITISDNVISAAGAAYTAGTGLSLTGTEFSVDTTVIAEKSDIPTVNDSTITFTNNGTTVDSFTTNESSAKTIALSAPVITMTTTDPGEGAVLAENNFIGVYGGDPIIMDYSTNEVETGVKWIDGSMIYKKTVNTGTLPNATFTTVAHNISNLSLVLKLEGWATNSTGTLFLLLPSIGVSSNTNNVAVTVSNLDINITTGSDMTSYTTSYVTVYYTKSS